MVDCGATTHIVTDKSKFVQFDESFVAENHYIELADGSRTNGVVSGKGTASVLLHDSEGKPHKVQLENALYVPSYNQDIFSVQAATGKGASVEFKPESAELSTPDGTRFEIEKQDRLYFLNKTESGTCNVKVRSHPVEEWHKILGHCNVRDVLKLESVVEGMNVTSKQKFECGTCVKGKMAQYRNREPDKTRHCQVGVGALRPSRSHRPCS